MMIITSMDNGDICVLKVHTTEGLTISGAGGDDVLGWYTLVFPNHLKNNPPTHTH